MITAGIALVLIAAWAYVLAYRTDWLIHTGGTITTTRPFGITITPREEYPAAVAAQEIWELRRQWRLFLIGSWFGKRNAELFSHALECAAAHALYGVDMDEYIRTEVSTMASYPWLKDLVDREGMYLRGWRIIPEIEVRIPKAQRWVAANRSILERVR